MIQLIHRGGVAEIWQVKGPVFLSLGCYNKIPQTEQLKITGIYSLEVLEDRSLKPRCWPCPLWSFLIRIYFIHAFLSFWCCQRPLVFLGCRHIIPSLPLSSCVVLSPCLCIHKRNTFLSVSSLPSHYTHSTTHHQMCMYGRWIGGWEGKFPKWSNSQILQAPAGSPTTSDIISWR